MTKAHRLLCLHGMYQNAELFAQKTAGLQQALGGSVELGNSSNSPAFDDDSCSHLLLTSLSITH